MRQIFGTILTGIKIAAFGLAVLVAGCGSPKPVTLDLSVASDTPTAAAIQMVSTPGDAQAVLGAAGITDPARQALITKLVPEVLADLTLFGAQATERPRDVRIVVIGDGSEDAVVSQRRLPLYRTLADALSAGSLPRLDVADRVLESRIAAIASNALDTGRKIDGSTITVVLKGLAHDGDRLLLTPQ